LIHRHAGMRGGEAGVQLDGPSFTNGTAAATGAAATSSCRVTLI
jgi:hypothetical protein